MITYRENRNDIIQTVEIDLTEIPDRKDLETKIKHIDTEHRKIFRFEVGNKLVYETEVLIPKVNKNRLNVLMVLGNPAIHSIAEKMFFSYETRRSKEGKETWIEHRFWKALRDCGILEFDSNIERPTPEKIKKINDYKRNCLLSGNYKSKFNIFLLTYFSFPTPASGKYNGVNGIKKIVGKDIFDEIKEFEFQRFKCILSSNEIRNVICFQQSASEEIKNRDNTLKHITLYSSRPTRLLHTNKGKEILKGIVSDIKAKNKIY